jgi:protein TonB
MNAAIAPSSYGTHDPSSRVKGVVIVVALHVLIGYALASGMARKGLDLIKKPLEAVVIQEVIIPPPPPPPKKVEPPKELPKVQAPPPPFVPPPDVPPPVTSTAPVIVSTPTPPPAPVVIAPPPPPAPPAPVVVAAPAPVATGPKRSAIGVACPTQVAPEMPRKALQDGTEGVVKAQILIKNGVVQEVTILSGSRVFHAAVKNAIAQYKCVADGPEVMATQEFNFKLE